MEKFQIHPSGLSQLGKCGVQFYFRYVEGLKIPPRAAMLTGLSAHKGRQLDLQRSLASGGLLLPDSELEDLVATDFRQRWKESGTVDVDDDNIPGRPQDHYLDRTLELARIHHEDLAPKLDPERIEWPFVLEVAGTNVQVAGTMDLVEKSTALSDLKNRRKSPSRDEADRSLQLTTYAVGYHRNTGVWPSSVRLDVGVTYKKKAAKLVQIESVRDEASVAVLEQRVIRAATALETGCFTPADPESWWCSADWCGYYTPREGFKGCPYAVRPVSTGER